MCPGDVVLEDRPRSPGVKLKDADLTGVPFLVVVGRAFHADGRVEVRRRSGESHLVPRADVAAFVAALLSAEDCADSPHRTAPPVLTLN